MKKIFISTAIDYVNAVPHLGHCFEKIQADVVARYSRLLGREVFFLTGTDENSLKNVRAAKKEGISVRDLVDKNSKRFYELKSILNLSFDDFIKTTEERNVVGVQKLWLACKKDIYIKKYKGLYCVDCEEFYKEEELINGLCPEHKTEPEIIEEENYFFKLSNYQKQLEEIIEKDKIKIIPKGRKNEILSFIKSGLQDFCISRSSKRAQGWGIDVPGDTTQKIWVWFDALSNYINALDYGERNKNFEEWWQKNENKLHCIGKGIIRFHLIYWPVILLSAGLALPNKIFVHGYITVDGQKMSKSLGNVINPFELVKKYGTDAVRYYLLREIPPTEDGDFTYEKFEARYNSDLAGGIGNLVARVLGIAGKTAIKKSKPTEVTSERIKEAKKSYASALEKFKFNEALLAVWNLISYCDKYINDEKLWETKKPEVINDLFCALDEISTLLLPFLPETAEKIKKAVKDKKSEILFPKIIN